MKKVFALIMALALVLSMCSFASADYSGEIKIWVAEATVDFTKAAVEDFKAANPAYAGITVTVEPVGEGDAANNMITDVTSGADIYIFAQDQLTRLVSAGAIEEMNPDFVEEVAANNDAGSVGAGKVGDTMYAYPVTSDNGYFMYYDSSVITDTSSLEAVCAQAEAAGKRVYFEINSGWYQTAFFFGTGCTLTYDTDDEGNYIACNCDYASDNGVKALKAMIALHKSGAFANGSSASSASDYAALVSGTWDAAQVQSVLGDNYAAVKLPTITVDGETFQLSGFGGFKLLGIKPQEDEEKLACCDELALYLTSGDVQSARFDAVQWGPSNLEAQQSDAVKSNVALSALADQLAYCIAQGQYPGDYWTLATALGDDVIAGKYDEYTDDQLMEVLVQFQATCESYAQ